MKNFALQFLATLLAVQIGAVVVFKMVDRRVGALSATIQERSHVTPKPTKWEYETLVFYVAPPVKSGSDSTVYSDETSVEVPTERLDKMGGDGWELVSVVYEPYRRFFHYQGQTSDEGQGAESIAIFKRPDY